MFELCNVVVGGGGGGGREGGGGEGGGGALIQVTHCTANYLMKSHNGAFVTGSECLSPVIEYKYGCMLYTLCGQDVNLLLVTSVPYECIWHASCMRINWNSNS